MHWSSWTIQIMTITLSPVSHSFIVSYHD